MTNKELIKPLNKLIDKLERLDTQILSPVQRRELRHTIQSGLDLVSVLNNYYEDEVKQSTITTCHVYRMLVNDTISILSIHI